MIKRLLPIFLLILFSGCSILPGLIQIQDPVLTAPSTENVVESDSIDKPEATATAPACPEVVCPTCAALPFTPSPGALNPIVTMTPTSTSSASAEVTPYQPQTPTATSTRTPAPYVLQQGTPRSQSNIFHSDAGCNWFGVAGQVFDNLGRPQSGLVLMVRGTYAGRTILAAGVTGYAAANVYGPGGYEIAISNQALDTINTLSIQLYNVQGQPLSDPVQFSTFSSCSQNLIIINFTVRP